MKLFIHLLNDKTDLTIIQESLKHFDCSIVVEDEDIVITTSSLFHDYGGLSAKKDLLKICSTTKGFLDSINGAAKLEDINLPELKLKKIAYENKNGSKNDLSNPVSIEVCFCLGSGYKMPISDIATLICKDEVVAKALRLYNKELDWVNLYRIFELIEKGPHSFPRGTYSNFKAHANHSETVGDNARHGQTREMPNITPLTLSTARAQISGMLREWLTEKINPHNDRNN